VDINGIQSELVCEHCKITGPIMVLCNLKTLDSLLVPMQYDNRIKITICYSVSYLK